MLTFRFIGDFDEMVVWVRGGAGDIWSARGFWQPSTIDADEELAAVDTSLFHSRALHETLRLRIDPRPGCSGEHIFCVQSASAAQCVHTCTCAFASSDCWYAQTRMHSPFC